ncbi:MAG: hypothetical protein IPP29_14230 [Bacteroidetes bacterium]|nr:hypothetical protein [Bacteroidota bacterium]
MKKLILAFTAVIITTGVYAQKDSTRNKMYPPDMEKVNDGLNKKSDRELDSIQKYKMENNRMPNRTIPNDPDTMMKQAGTVIHPDGYMMLNGKMMVVKNGELSTMEKDVTLTDGTIIMKSGYYMKKGETKLMFKEGEHIDTMGKTMPKK